jgi:acetoin utilization protein AcuB
MKTKVVTVTPRDTVAHARFLMHQSGVRHLPVVEGHNVVGVVSERDVRAPALPGWRDFEQVALDGTEVAVVMSTPPATMHPDDSAHAAANLMRGRKISCVPVVSNDSRLVGIITSTDILEAFGRTAATSRVRVPIRGRGSKR